MAKNNYYVVFEGRQVGIFNNWNQCKESVHGFKSAKYKGYSDLIFAEKAFKNYAKQKNRNENLTPVNNAICVDASYSQKTNMMEYRGVDMKTKKVLFLYSETLKTSSGVAEFLALVHGLAYIKKKGLSTKYIYSDCQTAIVWVEKRE